MGLFDFLNRPKTASPIANVMNPTTEAQMLAALDPRNMSMGDKLGQLGQAMFAAGSGVKGAELFSAMDQQERARRDGIRDRFDRLQERRRQEARDKRADFVSDRAYDRDVLTSDRTYDEGVRRYDEGQDYTMYRDTIGDMRDNRDFNRNVYTSDRDFNRNVFVGDRAFDEGVRQYNNDYDYQLFRDVVADQRDNRDFNYKAGQDNIRNARQVEQDAVVDDTNVYYDEETTGIAGVPNISIKNNAGQIESISPGDARYGYYASLLKARKAAQDAKNRKGQKLAPDGTVLLPGQIQQDKRFATELEKFRPAVAAANVAALRSISQGLGAGNTDAGGLADRALSLVDPEGNLGLRAILAEEGLDTQQRVEGIIQQSLRETLGAQFTQQEAFRLISRAYNPRLSPEANSKRLAMAANVAERLIALKQEKADHFNSTGGTLYGYKADLQPLIDQMQRQLEAVYSETENAGGNRSQTGTPNGGRTTSTGVTYTF